MAVASRSRLHSRTHAAPVLLISGVNISNPNTIPAERPRPDYTLIFKELTPVVLDLQSVTTTTNPLLRLIRTSTDPHWAIAFAALRQARNCQQIVATGNDVGFRLAFLFKLFRIKTPLHVCCHNAGTRQRDFFLGKLKVGSAISRFLCLSSAQAELFKTRYGITDDKIIVTSCAIDQQFFRPMPEVTVKHQICSAGRADRDYALFIEATRGLGVEVKIDANSAWWQEDLNIAVDKLPDHVEVFLGRTTMQLRQLYAESKFVVVPIKHVPFAVGYTVALEAMAMGKPVIMTRTGQPGDFLRDG
ncbi:MAG: glycosyltransferase, partial [Chloroflexaceae bacterium]|nr:glycosyltransferase [Chloroflexaceae bacterium]